MWPWDKADDVVRRFEQSMQIDYYKWHDGIGYDLDILRAATPKQTAQIEAILAARGIRDWRDAEALAIIDSPRARTLLQEALHSKDPAIVAAVIRYAPHVGSGQERAAAIISALERAQIGSGLIETLRQVEEYHPPEVIDALFRGVLTRDNMTAARLAAMLLYLHGRASSTWDDPIRDFYFRFYTSDREPPFRELCTQIGVDPANYLRTP